MKKLIVACAVVLGAGLFASCGDTNHCWEITATANVLGLEISNTNYYWCTSNEIKSFEADMKKALVDAGASEDMVTITKKMTTKSQAECKK